MTALSTAPRACVIDSPLPPEDNPVTRWLTAVGLTALSTLGAVSIWSTYLL